MTPKDQQKLFELVHQRYRNWHHRRISGYVHGVADGLKRREPRRVYIKRFKKNKPYALGYIYGFIDVYGGDALLSQWSKELELSEHSLNYRWWQNGE